MECGCFFLFHGVSQLFVSTPEMIHKLFEIFVFRAVYPQFLWRDVEHDKILVSFCVSASESEIRLTSALL